MLSKSRQKIWHFQNETYPRIACHRLEVTGEWIEKRGFTLIDNFGLKMQGYDYLWFAERIVISVSEKTMRQILMPFLKLKQQQQFRMQLQMTAVSWEMKLNGWKANILLCTGSYFKFKLWPVRRVDLMLMMLLLFHCWDKQIMSKNASNQEQEYHTHYTKMGTVRIVKVSGVGRALTCWQHIIYQPGQKIWTPAILQRNKLKPVAIYKFCSYIRF